MSDNWEEEERRYEAAEARIAELESENARLRKAIVNFANSVGWSADSWKEQWFIKALLDIAQEGKQ